MARYASTITMPADMGAILNKPSVERIRGYIDQAEESDAQILQDGRNPDVADALKDGYWVGPTLIEEVVTPTAELIRRDGAVAVVVEPRETLFQARFDALLAGLDELGLADRAVAIGIGTAEHGDAVAGGLLAGHPAVAVGVELGEVLLDAFGVPIALCVGQRKTRDDQGGDGQQGPVSLVHVVYPQAG